MTENNIIELGKGSTVNTGLAILGSEAVTKILDTVRNLPIMKEEDMRFLSKNSEHLGMVMEKTHMWRTDLQKVSIINDLEFPTVHSKFHQCILEQKVQFDNAMYLAKEYEDLKLDMETLQIEIEELQDINASLKPTDFGYRKNEIQIKKKTLDIQFKAYNLNQMRIAMDYRMQEVKGWQQIEENLLVEMRKKGMDEEEIWSKSTEELEATFMHAMSKLQALHNQVSTAEYNNLLAIAVHCYTQARNSGLLDKFRAKCNDAQLDSLGFLEKTVFGNNAKA